MSGEEIQLEYLGQTVSMKKSETYEEFISQLVSKLFLTEKMKKSMSLIYYDDDNDEIQVDNDENYSMFLSEADKAKLTIPEASNDLGGDYDNIKKEVEEKMKSIKDEINEYKIKLKESCQKIIKKKLKEVDDKNMKELKELEKYYENKLIKKKEESEEKITNLLNEMQNQSEEIILEKLNEYNKNIEKEIQNIIKGKEQSFQEKVNKIEFEKLEQKQKDVEKVVENNKKELFNAISD
jgi:hypothetical protein